MPSCEGGRRAERAGGGFLVFAGNQYAVTKEQPPHAFGISLPSQEGSLDDAHFAHKKRRIFIACNALLQCIIKDQFTIFYHTFKTIILYLTC